MTESTAVAEVTAKSESPEVAVTVAPAKVSKSDIRKRLKAEKVAALLNLTGQRVVTIIGEQAEMVKEVRRTLCPYLAEMHGTWAYVPV